MKKMYFILILMLFLIQPVLAVNLNIQKVSDKEIMVAGLQSPANFILNVTNNGASDEFSFYTFFGPVVSPNESIQINAGETKLVEFKVSPRSDLKLRGQVSFPYFVQGDNKSEVEEKLTVRVIELKDAFKLGADSINPESGSVNIYLENQVNFDFNGLKVHLSSPFFEEDRVVDIPPYGKEDFKIELNKDDFSKLTAGFYTLLSDLEIKDISAHIEESIDFKEKNILREDVKEYGLIISTTLIKKFNEGNTVQDSSTLVKKNSISRIFTTFSPEPNTVSRDGFTVSYIWNKKINPGESFEVEVKTNWFIPFLVILLVILTVIFARKYSKTDIVLRKRVSFMNAKGGEFALKIMINIESRKFIENVRIFDRLPPLVKIYERFGGETPKRFNKTKRMFEWELGTLEAGEKRMLSYVIYSRVGVLGRFALPSAYAMFEREGKQKEVNSNKAFFLADQKSE